MDETRYHILVENSRDLIYHFRLYPTAGFEYVSPSSTSLTGYTQQEYYADPQLGYKLIHPDDRSILNEVIQSRAIPANPLVLRWIRKDGLVIWVEQQVAFINDAAGSLTAVECSARDITERMQRSFEFEAIVAIGASMRHAATRSELVAIILQRCLEMLDAQGIALVVRDPFSGKTVIEQGCGLLAPTAGVCLPGEANLAGLTGSNTAFQANHTGLAGIVFASLPQATQIPFMTYAPLVVQQELTGVMFVVHECEITAAQIRLLTTVNEIAANALQRTTLSERASHYTHQMAIAGELGLMLAKTLDLSAIYALAGQFMRAMLPGIHGLIVALLDPSSSFLNCVYGYTDGQEIDVAALPPAPLAPPGQGMQSQAVHTRRPVIIADMDELRKQMQLAIFVGDNDKDPRSGLFVPMISYDRVIGVVNVQSYIPNRFSQQDAEVMTLVSNTTAVAIETHACFGDCRHPTRNCWRPMMLPSPAGPLLSTCATMKPKVTACALLI